MVRNSCVRRGGGEVDSREQQRWHPEQAVSGSEGPCVSVFHFFERTTLEREREGEGEGEEEEEGEEEGEEREKKREKVEEEED